MSVRAGVGASRAISETSPLEAVFAAAAVAAITALGSLVIATRLGLTSVHQDATEGRRELVSSLKDRLTLVELQNSELRAHVAKLEAENAQLRLRLDVVERRYISDVLDGSRSADPKEK